MVIVLMGPPGCGKGTQARFVCQGYPFVHVSTGDLVRAEIASSSHDSIQMKSLINAGKLIPNEMVFNLIMKSLSDPSRSYLCDGFPRTLDQAVMLDAFLNESGLKVDAVVNINVPDEVILKRLSGRLSCGVCKTIFNSHFNPPVQKDTCDNCSARLERRSDDAPAVVTARLSDYHMKSVPILDYFRSKNVLFDVSGDRSSGDVFAEVEKILKKDH